METSSFRTPAFVSASPVASSSLTASSCLSRSSRTVPRFSVARSPAHRVAVPSRRFIDATLATESRPVTPVTNVVAPRSASSPIHRIASPAELALLLQGQPDARSASNCDITVIKIFASYCAACRGVAPKYRKLAAAYSTATSGDHDGGRSPNIKFCEMDFKENEDFCKNALGVQSLPFFVVFRGDSLSAAESIGWRSVNQRLVDLIDEAIVTPLPNVSA